MSADRVFADNPLCRLLGIGYPILQAGMYQVAWGPLAAAVSNAGGLGVIGSAFMPSSRLRQEIRIAKAETDRPFGVDILFAKVPAAARRSPGRGRAGRPRSSLIRISSRRSAGRPRSGTHRWPRDQRCSPLRPERRIDRRGRARRRCRYQHRRQAAQILSRLAQRGY